MNSVRRRMSVPVDDLRWIGMQAGVVAAGVFVYFRVRGITESSPHTAVAHAHQIVSFERALHLYVESDIQAAVAHLDVLITFANWIYIYGHWPVIAVTMLWLAARHRRQFARLRDGMMISGGIGLVIFALYPVAPPRLAELGIADTVTQRSESYRLLQPPAFVNQYAAMPSLHAGWDLLVGIAIATAAGHLWLRWIGRLLPALMVFAIVTTGNHYIVDAVAGITLALVGHTLAALLERRRERAHAGAATPLPAVPFPAVSGPLALPADVREDAARPAPSFRSGASRNR